MNVEKNNALLDRVKTYYNEKLMEYGASSRGVDWKDETSQLLRFHELLNTAQIGETGSILDFGCGYGALLPILKARGYRGKYTGLDISKDMISKAKEIHPEKDITWITSLPKGERFDYVVASGIFNVKLEHADNEWKNYVFKTLGDINLISRKAFVFNILSTYSDKEFRRPGLYYADPLEWFDICKRSMSSQVILNHGYPLYEFTLAVLKKIK